MRRWLKSLIAGSLALGWLTVAAVPASAASPVREEFSFEDAFVTDELCGFPIEVSFVGDGTVTTYFNEDGNPTMVQVHVSDDATVTNPANQKTFTGHETVNVREDLEAGTVTEAGILIHQNAPGYGAVLLEVGRVVFDEDFTPTFVAGPHQSMEGDFDEFCAALS